MFPKHAADEKFYGVEDSKHLEKYFHWEKCRERKKQKAKSQSPLPPNRRDDSAVMPLSMTALKPIILHLGDPILYNHDTFDRLQSQFDIINPPLAERHRSTFLNHLREKKWGDFHAIMRPFWNTGGEMGRWDRELIAQLPKSVKVYASAGAGFDWVDTDILAEYGEFADGFCEHVNRFHPGANEDDVEQRVKINR